MEFNVDLPCLLNLLDQGLFIIQIYGHSRAMEENILSLNIFF